ncbi:hypothetical protein MYX84_16105, partial [Acidobacteria bacterium AH-259-O06]|nr:hypothetical protein [Acidobacteria bacterium AH-259-O06]
MNNKSTPARRVSLKPRDFAKTGDQDLASEALRLVEAGVSIIPIRTDGSKAPAVAAIAHPVNLVNLGELARRQREADAASIENPENGRAITPVEEVSPTVEEKTESPQTVTPKQSGPKRQKKCRPEIDAGNQDLSEVTGESWAALQEFNSPEYLFRYGDSPARLEHNDVGALVVNNLSRDMLRNEVDRAAKWVRRDSGGGTRPAHPPMPIIRNMLATADAPLPVLYRITEVPVFAPDSTLQTEPGYHPAAHVYYEPAAGLTIPQVPERPTQAQITQARSLIFDNLLVDFPFVAQADRAHAIAMMLLPYVRDLIKGATPNHLVESPTPGSGKGLLVDGCLSSSLGLSLKFIPQSADEAEWRKRITASLREGVAAIVIDNIKQPLDSGALA